MANFLVYVKDVLRDIIMDSGWPLKRLTSQSTDLLRLEKDNTTILSLDEDGRVNALSGGSTSYAGTGSFQVVAPDLELDAAAGSSTDPKFLAAVMGNVFGENLSKTKPYLAGVIGACSITGTRATTYPMGAVLAQISDGSTLADGAVVAYVDGDSGVTKANAAFKAMCNNSNAGSGFDYGVDLYSPAHDGYVELPILKAAVRMNNQVCILNGSGAPVDGTTGDNFAGPGSIYIDIVAGNAYIQTSAVTTPVWKLITRAA